MNVYFISGLAADKRAFRLIELPVGYNAIYLNWTTPLAKETLKEYALRMAKNIDSSEPFILVGLSMGGMIATEIARNFSPQLTILISSASSARHFPPWFTLSAFLGLHKIIPARFFKSASLIKRLFTNETTEVKNLIKDITIMGNIFSRHKEFDFQPINFESWKELFFTNPDNQEAIEKIKQACMTEIKNK